MTFYLTLYVLIPDSLMLVYSSEHRSCSILCSTIFNLINVSYVYVSHSSYVYVVNKYTVPT